MRTSRFTESQIVAILKEADSGVPINAEKGVRDNFYTEKGVRDNFLQQLRAWDEATTGPALMVAGGP